MPYHTQSAHVGREVKIVALSYSALVVIPFTHHILRTKKTRVSESVEIGVKTSSSCISVPKLSVASDQKRSHHGGGLGWIGRGTQAPRPLQPYANDVGSCNGSDAGNDAKTSAVGDHVDASPVFVRFHRVVIAGAGATPARPSHPKSS